MQQYLPAPKTLLDINFIFMNMRPVTSMEYGYIALLTVVAMHPWAIK